MKYYDEIISKLSGNIFVVSHQNADPDAFGAAQGIKELIELCPSINKVFIKFPSGPSNLSQKLIDDFGVQIYNSLNVVPNGFIVVDTGSLNQLAEYENEVTQSDSIKIFIDHHLKDEQIQEIADIYLLDNNVSSTSELVYTLFKEKGIKPSLITAKALLSGIIFDTKFLSIGGAETFKTISELLETVGSISDVRDLMLNQLDISERIARLTAAKRMQIIKIKDWIITVSEVGHFQSSAARSLLNLGSDMSIACFEQKGALRASMRSTNDFYDISNFHLGEFTYELGKKFQGSGSGHPTAAGFNGIGELEKFISYIIEVLREKLS